MKTQHCVHSNTVYISTYSKHSYARLYHLMAVMFINITSTMSTCSNAVQPLIVFSREFPTLGHFLVSRLWRLPPPQSLEQGRTASCSGQHSRI